MSKPGHSVAEQRLKHGPCPSHNVVVHQPLSTWTEYLAYLTGFRFRLFAYFQNAGSEREMANVFKMPSWEIS